MLESENMAEVKVLKNYDGQGNDDAARQRLNSSGPSVTTNPDGDVIKLSKRCVIFIGIIVAIVSVGLIISGTFNGVFGGMLRCYQTDPGPSDVSLCSQDWIKEGEVAYFFSKVERDWNSSQSFCSSCAGSLLAIENTQEMAFIMKNRDPAEYWLGLSREKVQHPWKRPNGSVFNNWYPIQGEGLCAYLNDQVVSSTWCTNIRYWICKKLLRGS